MNTYACFVKHRGVVVAAHTEEDALALAVKRFKLKPHQAHKIDVRIAQHTHGGNDDPHRHGHP
jgi:hypothetical protein